MKNQGALLQETADGAERGTFRPAFDVDTDPPTLFAHLDDHRRLASHMEKPSLMMAGATMRVTTDARQGQEVGSMIRVTGQVLGLKVVVDEEVIERVSPVRKTWETRAEPRLLVIGAGQDALRRR